MEQEIWKYIPLYEWLYEVSNLWRIRSVDRYVDYRIQWCKALKKWRIIKIKKQKWWYCSICLCKNNIKKDVRIHRIVAITFLEPSHKKCVNHKNWIKTDNRLENLEWCTHTENIQHAVRTWLFKKHSK